MRALLLLSLLAPALEAQQDTTLLRRWVGNHRERSLTFEFYGDSMLVVGDRHALHYRLTPDSLTATGDSNFAVRYRLSYGRLLLETPDGEVVTMSRQSTLGRPLTGRWVGELQLGDSIAPGELRLDSDRSAAWRVDGGKNRSGEWERQARRVTLTWDDGTEWSGLYDPNGNTLLVEPVADSTGAVRPGGASGVLRRVFR